MRGTPAVDEHASSPLRQARPWLWTAVCGAAMLVLAVAVIIRDADRAVFLASAGWILVPAAVEFGTAFREPAFPEGRMMAIVGTSTFGAGILLLVRPTIGYLSLLQLAVAGFALRGAGSFVVGLMSRRRLRSAWGWIAARGAVDVALSVALLAGSPLLIFFYIVGWQSGAEYRLAAILAFSMIAAGSLLAVARDQRRHSMGE